MAITRRQFVSTLSALTAAVGMSQADLSRVVEAFAYSGDQNAQPGVDLGGTLGKPRVVWIHGAECTGCSTSLLGIFEDVTKGAFPKSASPTIADAATLAGVFPTQLAGNSFTYHALNDNPDYATSMNIADVVVDVIDLQYHETVMGMGADLAAQWLKSFTGAGAGTQPFVLVVEGALQPKAAGGAWNDTAGTSTDVPWCSIAHEDNPAGWEADMPTVVRDLAVKANCIGVVPIGQCATYSGYPGCKPQISTAEAKFGAGGFDPRISQTNAMGTYDFLKNWNPTDTAAVAAAAKVINVPGCPTNPWWFVLSVVCFLVDLLNTGTAVGDVGPTATLVRTTAGATGALVPFSSDIALSLSKPASAAGLDNTRRIKKVYGNPIHGPYCPRYQSYVNGIFASKPGEAGCLQKIGCKGPAASSLCGIHGWNNQQPQNPTAWDYGVSGVNGVKGGHCTTAGHPCMACTEKGYPDSFVPFVVLK